MIKLTEESRHRIALILAVGGWVGAIIWTGVLTYYNINNPAPKPPMPIQRLSGIFIILLMGTGIAACTSLSRMRLSRTIVAAFEQGYKLTRPEKVKSDD